MTETTIHVRALHSNGVWLIDCTLCGPLAVLHHDDAVNLYCYRHLEDHGIDTTHAHHTTGNY